MVKRVNELLQSLVPPPALAAELLEERLRGGEHLLRLLQRRLQPRRLLGALLEVELELGHLKKIK